MNLAAALYAADVRLEAVKNEVEALLTSLFSGWQSWAFHPVAGVEVFGAFESATAAARLFQVGFASAQFHDHRASERIISCRCKVFEAP